MPDNSGDIPLIDRLIPAIRPYLESFGLDNLETSPQSIYCYDTSYNLSYFNPSWVEFGLANGNTPTNMKQLLGSSVLENWPTVMAKRFLDIFNQVLEGPELTDQEPARVRYLCHSPENYREYAMDVLPLPDKAGLLMVNHLVVEREHEEAATAKLDYKDQTGYITQCANCGKVRHPQNKDRWDLVVEFIENPIIETSHGLCTFCFRNYLLLE